MDDAIDAVEQKPKPNNFNDDRITSINNNNANNSTLHLKLDRIRAQRRCVRHRMCVRINVRAYLCVLQMIETIKKI